MSNIIIKIEKEISGKKTLNLKLISQWIVVSGIEEVMIQPEDSEVSV